MSNLPLRVLKWDGDMLDTPLHTYQYLKDHDSKGRYMVKYAGKNRSLNEPARGFATIDDAKQWAWNHYSEKMQPYVVASPTWIDVDKHLPNEDGKYIVSTGSYKGLPDADVDNFNSESKKWEFFNKDDLPSVLAWMPIPEFSTMQNLHKGE